jgi:hypothetical protein
VRTVQQRPDQSPSWRGQLTACRGPVESPYQQATGAPSMGPLKWPLQGPPEGPPADSVGALPVARG